MKTKRIWANLAVSDLKRTRDFYTTLGFTVSGSEESKELVSFSFGENNFIINFFLKHIIESNAKLKFSDLQSDNEIIFSISADSKKEVNAWKEQVIQAGGKVFAEPYEIGEGYTFGFSDPDHHKFNVLYWPGM
ncbi:VOC family protein [Chryseobacterium sp. MYb264]|uniref:VOC family protein n=1 Tax=Chryseobacterium sp. MYb264 TaxID=2745153 RepID=UPI002E1673C1|nr:VOC family protein [Chryseobacterium sp. MYb264]